MIRFHLDRRVKLTFYEQIKGQLLSAIYCGKIQEGDRIPSIRELAEDQGVNYKTIRNVYLKLAEEDYVELVRGSGAFLKKRGPDTYEQMRQRAIFKLVEEVGEKAAGLGLKAQGFARLLEANATGANLARLKLAVVDHEEEAFIFSRELRERLGAEVSAVPLEKADDNGSAEQLQGADYLLTTSWHLDEVREVASRYDREVLEIKPSHHIYTEILEAAREKNIGIVIQDERTMHASWEIFMNLYHPTTQKKFWIAPIDREELLDKIIREADVIFVSPMCWDEVRRRAPADRELRTYENFISEETIRDLKRRLLLG